MIRTRPAAGLVVVTCLALAVSGGTVSGAATAAGPTAGAAARGPLLLPKAGAELPARPVQVRVRAGTQDRLHVRLNGRAIGADFGPSRRGVRTLRVSPTDGLRHGANRLRVRVKPQGRRARVAIRRFTVARTHPLAAAGRDRAIATGSRVRLDGRASRPRPNAGPPLRYAWRLLSGPRVPRLARASVTRDHGLRAQASAQPTFRADVPGTYRLRLTVTHADGRSGSDLLTVKVDPRPALAVDTMARDASGAWGISLDGRLWPARRGAWLQVLRIDRGTGVVSSNASFDCPDLSRFIACANTVQAALSRFTTRDLVIAANQPEGGGTAGGPRGAGFALNRLALPQTASVVNDGLLRGTYSAIGAPGNPGGGGVEHVAPANTVGAGEIKGWLVRNNRLNYVFATGERTELDTQAPGSDARQNVIQVGDRRYVETGPGTGPGGIQVVTVDHRTLQGSSRWFATGGAKGQAALDTLNALRDTLQQAGRTEGTIVLVASRGRSTIDARAYDGLVRSHDLYHAIRDAATAITDLGGTRGRFYAAIDGDFNPGNASTYTLAGRARAGTGGGEESLASGATGAQGELNRGPIGGTLTRSRSNYGFELSAPENEPIDGAQDGPHAGDLVVETVFQDATPWPETGNAGRTAAIALVGDRANLGTDPRGLYYTQPYQASFWNAAATRIANLRADPLPAGVMAADFAWAQKELQSEIAWLGDANGYLVMLASPYASTSLKSWADLQSAAATVNADVQADPSAKAEAITAEVFDAVRDLLSTLAPEVRIAQDLKLDLGKAFDIANIVYDSALEIAETARGESSDDDFAVATSDLGLELAARLQDAQDVLTGQYFKAVAADYGKLRRVGGCGARDDACPDRDLTAWQVTDDELRYIGQSLRGGLKAEFYASLLGAKYTRWRIPQLFGESYRDARKWVGHGALGAGDFPPFGASAANGQLAEIVCRDMNDHSRDQWQVWALGVRTGGGTWADPWQMQTPGAGVVDTLFAPIDPERFPERGGLGADRAAVFARSFARRTQDIDHFPHDTSVIGWEPFNYPGDCDRP